MCYDISFTVKLKELAAYFPDLETAGQLELDFGGIHIMGHSFNEHPIICRDRENQQLLIRPMQWGVIPFYVKDENGFLRQRVSMLNTRSERILGDEKSYWFKIRNRRCLIPVTGVYEHRDMTGAGIGLERSQDVAAATCACVSPSRSRPCDHRCWR